MSTIHVGLAADLHSCFEHPDYLAAAAAHDHCRQLVIGTDSRLVLFQGEKGYYTPYGYPEPFGDRSQVALSELARQIVQLQTPTTIALSPLSAGGQLTALIAEQGAEVVGRRPIAVADLDRSVSRIFSVKARNKVRRAERAGATVEITSLQPWFGAFYRKEMARLQSDSIYRFSDAYFERLALTEHALVHVRDEHGTAAAALFLYGRVGSYHLSARRDELPEIPGVVNLAVSAGLEEARRRGVETVILGGGRSVAEDDSLLRFKREMATRVLERLTLFVAGSEEI